MSIEATRTQEWTGSSFLEEFGNLIKCKCLQCRLEENLEHTRLMVQSAELPQEAVTFYH